MTPIRALLRTIAVTLTLLTMIAGAMLVTTPSASAKSAASESQARSYYGAIALGKDGATGYGTNYRTRAGAYDRALRECNQRSAFRCVKVGWVRNACGAVAVKFNSSGTRVTRYKYGYAVTRHRAEANARRNFGGQIRAWVCTKR